MSVDPKYVIEVYPKSVTKGCVWGWRVVDPQIRAAEEKRALDKGQDTPSFHGLDSWDPAVLNCGWEKSEKKANRKAEAAAKDRHATRTFLNQPKRTREFTA